MPDHPTNEVKRGKWHVFDRKFKRGMFGHYVTQTLLATAFTFLLLIVLHQLRQLVIVAALGSSAFVVFAMPHKKNSHPRFVVGGHLVCFLTGTCLRLLTHNWLFHYWKLSASGQDIIACSLAVGASLFTMVITDTEHPPAAGVAVQTAISDFSVATAVTVVFGAASLSLGKFLLRRWLKDLL